MGIFKETSAGSHAVLHTPSPALRAAFSTGTAVPLEGRVIVDPAVGPVPVPELVTVALFMVNAAPCRVFASPDWKADKATVTFQPRPVPRASLTPKEGATELATKLSVAVSMV